MGTLARETLELALVGREIVVKATDEVPLKVKSFDKTADATISRPHEVSLSGLGRVLVERPDGLLLVVELKDFYVHLQELEVQAEDVPAFAEFDVDLKPYIATIDDPWLRELVKECDVNDPWMKLVGLGLVRRYGPMLAKDKKRIVDQLMAGTWKPPTEEWSESLTPEQIRTIESMVVAACFETKQSLVDLMDHYSPSDPDWIKSWVLICHIRDDIEGISWVVSSDTISKALEDLDKFAREITVAVPLGLAPDDKRLLFASQYDRDVWWVEPVTESPDF